MKIGLFITGHLRNSPKTYENYAQFLDGHDTDVYVGTWSTYDFHRSKHQIINEPVSVEDIIRPIFGSNLKELWIGDMEKFLNNVSPANGSPRRLLWNEYIEEEKDLLKCIYPWPQRTMDQWYVVYELYRKSIEMGLYNTYDVCIRIRNDMTFIGKPRIPFEDVRDGIHVNGINWWHNPADRGPNVVDGTGLVPYALSDQLAWGTPHWMKKHFEHYLYFAPLWAGRANWTNWSAMGDLPPEHRNRVGSPEALLFNSEHLFSLYLLRFEYYRNNLDPDNIHDHDMPWHRHGHDHRWGEHSNMYADYYDIIKRSDAA